MQLAAAKNLETTEDEHFAVIGVKAVALFAGRRRGRPGHCPRLPKATARRCAPTA